MSLLAERQLAMARALLCADAPGQSAVAGFFVGNAGDGLRVHRNTVLGACVQSLRLSYPALERWLGADTFEALAVAFARAYPPRAPALDLYGEAFIAAAADRAYPAQRALTAAIAAFDWEFERVARAPRDAIAAGIALDGDVRLSLAQGLAIHDSSHEVDVLREQLLTDAPVTAPAARPVHLALWNTAEGLRVRRIHACTAGLLHALQAGAEWSPALAAAEQAAGRAGISTASLAALLQEELLQAGFVRLHRGD